MDSADKMPFQCGIASFLSVRNGAKAVDFYQAAFGADESWALKERE